MRCGYAGGLFRLLFVVFEGVALNIASRAVAVATNILTISVCHILAGLLNGTLNASLLHMAVGRNLRVDVVSLEDQRQRHSQHKQPYGGYRNQYYGKYGRHNFGRIKNINVKNFALYVANI